MRKIVFALALMLCLGSCGKELPETEVPQTVLPEEPPRTAVPVEEVPPVIAVVEEPAPDAPPPVNTESWGGEIHVPDPSFTPIHITISRFGDFKEDLEQGTTSFVEENISEIEYGCGVIMDFPDSWRFQSTTSTDIPRMEAGWYSCKRNEYYSFLYRTPESDREKVDWVEQTTPAGQIYRYWEETGGTLEGLGMLWHHCEYPVPVGEDTFWFHIYFLTFSNDPAGYFEEHIQPVINSVVIAVDE